ncbi:hypothetical protein COCNU_06G016740 [Cocos nucifera]|uniref:Uncharacterized protein n=1 Tax=Cocos nucifera TaxID=13894 RepID=A0A8K0N3R1_COCNU|nr:hypothetical protein COCNU_06G016740 [Cocos nucifera]
MVVRSTRWHAMARLHLARTPSPLSLSASRRFDRWRLLALSLPTSPSPPRELLASRSRSNPHLARDPSPLFLSISLSPSLSQPMVPHPYLLPALHLARAPSPLSLSTSQRLDRWLLLALSLPASPSPPREPLASRSRSDPHLAHDPSPLFLSISLSPSLPLCLNQWCLTLTFSPPLPLCSDREIRSPTAAAGPPSRP